MTDQKTEQKNDRRTRNTSLAPGLIVLSCVLVAIVAVALVFLSRMGLLRIPFLQEEQTSPVVTEKSFADELLSRLPPLPESGSDGVSLEITEEDLAVIVSEAAEDTDHVHRMKVTYSSSVTRMHYAEVVAKNGKIRADLLREDGVILKRMIYDAVRIQVFDGATAQSKVFSMNEWFSLSEQKDGDLFALLYGFSPKGEIGVPSISDVLQQLDKEQIRDYRIELVREEGEHYIRISFTYVLTGVQEAYDLDLETGIILRAQSSLNGEVYYTVETEELSFDVSEYEDSFFKIQ